MAKETKQIKLDDRYLEESEKWARQVPREFMQYGILAVGVSD